MLWVQIDYYTEYTVKQRGFNDSKIDTILSDI